MELEIGIEKILYNEDQLESIAPHNCQMEIVGTETFDEEESFAF
jgi:hypothetical protein